ncbi:phosphatase PAP2 family protein [Hymenobacter sp. BT770]|uniref:phosphatase PAP2 family protein n=1 Tax=Hymenobacter sp. BT770 TaxID=2886942 RepID=UPI001D1005F3|nr:phosphatase PAP2 family protein [Hymenobacter sp. BT770]MCC3155458.1 phosphatase PAP2 family protein [Hymenobacter sp. BT770]MDO3417465.1 phosphatase PAP2 family protein [Hymenobacter sp. BT770]
MKPRPTLFLAGAFMLSGNLAAIAQQAPSPYGTRFAVDAPITVGLAGLSVTGLYLVQQKHVSTEAELAALNRQNIPKIDRFSAGWYSDRAQVTSDAFCYGTLALVPALLAFDPKVHGRYGQVAGLYLETMSATAAIFTLTVGTVYRSRPYLYGTEGGSKRHGTIATDSFFGGHTAHTATATFFAAQVFHDFNPGSAAQPYVWGAAAALPAVVAYFRVRAGKHFLTDNLVGYAVGATVGIVVPRLHHSAAGYDAAAVPAQNFTGSLVGCGVGAAAGVVALHFYKKVHGTGVSMVPMQGLNVNGYAYGGLMLARRW